MTPCGAIVLKAMEFFSLIVSHIVSIYNFLPLRNFVILSHPRLNFDVPKPIGDCGYATTTVFFYVLLSYVTDGNLLPIAVNDVLTKYSFTFKNALRVMSQGSVSKVSEDLLGSVEPVMDRRVILEFSSP
jgi:hypothetical protein